MHTFHQYPAIRGSTRANMTLQTAKMAKMTGRKIDDAAHTATSGTA